MTIVLHGGRLIDPEAGVDRVTDVVIDGSAIAAVGDGAGAAFPEAERHDLTGRIVTPGLIDLHAHVFPGLGDFCLPPDVVGVATGVPVVIDGGTSGATTFEVSRTAYVDHPETETRVLCLLDPNQIYLANKGFICHHLRLADDERNLDLDVTRRILERNDDIIVGFKVRACHTGDPTISPFLEGAKSIAGERPIMVHLGPFPHTPVIPTVTLLEALRPGDIITHAFRSAGGMLDDDGEITPELRAAVDRGVRLDVGHSGTDFRFRVARQLIDHGFLPDTISTDLNVFNVDGPVYDLPTTMTKIWHLGVDLGNVVAMATTNAAASINRSGELGTLAAGRSAEVSVLEVVDGPFELSDGYVTETADRRLAPVGCYRAGRWFDAIDRAGRSTTTGDRSGGEGRAA